MQCAERVRQIRKGHHHFAARGYIVIIKQVPADVCENCGEYYLSQGVTSQVLEKAEDAVKKGAEVEILRFAA